MRWAVQLVVHAALTEAARTSDAGGLAAQVVRTRRTAVVIGAV